MVQVGYTVKGTDAINRHLDAILSKLTDNGSDGLKQALAFKGLTTAAAKFATAQYDGTNDVMVQQPYSEGDAVILEARGEAVAFIEFGTGVHYSEEHPKAAELGMIRGGYGYHLGNLDSWRYVGDPGTNGVEDDRHPGYIKTHGNPPARAMYEAGKEMRNELAETAREVLRK